MRPVARSWVSTTDVKYNRGTYGSSAWLYVSDAFLHRFFYKLVIDKKHCYTGEGKSVKKAQQRAAQQAWSDLHEQSDWDTKVFSILLLVYIQTYGL